MQWARAARGSSQWSGARWAKVKFLVMRSPGPCGFVWCEIRISDPIITLRPGDWTNSHGERRAQGGRANGGSGYCLCCPMLYTNKDVHHVNLWMCGTQDHSLQIFMTNYSFSTSSADNARLVPLEDCWREGAAVKQYLHYKMHILLKYRCMYTHIYIQYIYVYSYIYIL